MTTSVQSPKRNHHYVPKLYLKGFTLKPYGPFIWVYKRLEPYNPGMHGTKNNPYKASLKKAGMQRDFYADQTPSGTVDYETVENQLEKLEKVADPIFLKIRAHQQINDEEKRLFSLYTILLHRRVPQYRQSLVEMTPKTLAAYDPPEELLRMVAGENDEEKRAFIRSVADNVSKDAAYPAQAHLKVVVNVETSILVHVLNMMTWNFYVASKDEAFLTGDDPVYFPKTVGLRKNISELSFPVATDVALVASWRNLTREQFIDAPKAFVKEINRRTATQALQNIYFAKDEAWVVTLLGRTPYAFRPLYHSDAIFNVI